MFNCLKIQTPKSFLLVISLFLSFNLYSQNIKTARLDSLFNAIESSNKFMGSVTIVKKSEVLYQRQIGFEDLHNHIKANQNTIYRIGSISKTYTATLILKAQEEGKLNIDDYIVKYFPNITNANKITIRNLLNHSSGLHNFTKDKEYLEYRYKNKSKKQMLKIIEKAGIDFEPNAKSSYSNSNYVLLSFILEKIYAQSFAQILQNKIAIPLSLSKTYQGGKKINKNEAHSYLYDSISWKKERPTNLNIFKGTGAIVATPTEVIKFLEALFNGKIISQKSLDMMLAIKNDFGFGVGEFSFEERLSYGHTGHVDSFNAVFGYFPKEEISFVITSNGGVISNNDIAVGILSIIFDYPYQIPNKF